ncbi:MAG: GntP family permease [Bacteroidota bacterium]
MKIKFGVKPYIILLLASVISGLLLNLKLNDISTLIFEGFKNIITGIGPIIIIGTILGKFLQETGATSKMVTTFISMFGLSNMPLTFNILGFIISIPVFCDAAFILMSSIIKEISRVSGRKMIILTVCLATGLYSAHVFVPPTPGPLAASALIGADVGLLLLIGLTIGIAVSLAGYIWIRVLLKKDFQLSSDSKSYYKLSNEKSITVFLPIIIPIILISISTLIKYPSLNIIENEITNFIDFIGKPEVSLFIGLIISTVFIKRDDSKNISKWIGNSLKNSFDILLITGAGGALGFIIRSSGLIESLGIVNFNGTYGLVSVFLIAALIKTVQGSSTVAIITTCALVAPLADQIGIISEIEKVLIITSIGSGAMTVSHFNDSYFWVVTKYSNLEIKEVVKFFTSATLVQGLIGLLTSVVIFLLLT